MEAILNAIAHRDYSIQNGIEIYIYTNRMEIKSPGALLSTLNVNSLYQLEGAHESRNPLIARVLRENKLMRELGEGMKRIFDLMNENELEKPVLYSNGLWFSVTLNNKTVYSQRQQEFLRFFSKSNLTNNQKKIVLLGIDDKEISPADIKNAINSTDLLTYNTAVTELRKNGLLVEIRNNVNAKTLAFKLRKPKDQIARFKVKRP